MKTRFFIPAIFALVIHAAFFFSSKESTKAARVVESKPSPAAARPVEKRKVSTMELTFTTSDAEPEVENAPRVPAPKIELRKEDFVDARANDVKPMPTDASMARIAINPEWVKEARERESSPEGKQWLESMAERHGQVQRLEALDRVPVVRSEAAALSMTEPGGDRVEVWVMFVINRDGKVVEAKADAETPVAFVSAAEAVVLGWTFDPGIMKGKPVSFRMMAPVYLPRNGP